MSLIYIGQLGVTIFLKIYSYFYIYSLKCSQILIFKTKVTILSCIYN